MNKLEDDIRKTKDLYESIKVPPYYDAKVHAVIAKNKVPKYSLKWLKRTACATLAVVLMGIAGLNLSPAFALAASDIPVLGDIAQVLTFRQSKSRA